MLKHEHSTWAVPHKTLTLDHRACKKHVNFNLGCTKTRLLGQPGILHQRIYVLLINMDAHWTLYPLAENTCELARETSQEV